MASIVYVYYYKTISNALANATSLHNVAFFWLTREYMHLASSFMQLAAAGGRGNIVPLHCLFEGKC